MKREIGNLEPSNFLNIQFAQTVIKHEIRVLFHQSQPLRLILSSHKRIYENIFLLNSFQNRRLVLKLRGIQNCKNSPRHLTLNPEFKLTAL